MEPRISHVTRLLVAAVALWAALSVHMSHAAEALAGDPDVDRFRVRGSFAVDAKTDQEVRITAAERIKVDLYLAQFAERAPLAIFVHGYDSSKEAHGKQAEHLASWGIHSMTVQLPNKGPWDANGRALGRLVRYIQRTPAAIDRRIDASRIVLIGYSFGAVSVATALAEAAPVRGAILLDPAASARDITPTLLRRVNRPVMVIGADDDIHAPRNRDLFFEAIRGDIAEVSVRGAIHEDAQFPTDYALENGGFDPDATEAVQITFVSAITATALALGAAGTLDSAWESFKPALASGRLFNEHRKW